MSDSYTNGTLVSMRTMRRFQHYNAGEIIAVPMAAAQDLAAKRLAQPLHLLVPTGPTVNPERQTAPAGIVKK